jgi:phytoene dehydrogenase-like protein
MQKSNKDIYDAIIIGAGISGLVCGGYLAKAGLKVLIIEQHNKPGGYCTSFKRKGFIFDAAAHSFGSYREGGIVKKVLSDLGIDKFVNVKRSNPTDIIISPDFKITFWNDTKDTISDLISVFPDEKDNIIRFFNFLSTINQTDFIKLRNKTFKDFLNSFFTNNKLINAISLPILGNGGLPPSLINAFSGISIFIEFLIDGGYYFQGGIQTLSNALDKIIRQNKGKILYKRLAKKILCKNDEVFGIRTDNNETIFSKYVISACDIRQTFTKLLGGKIVGKQIIEKLNNMVPSLSGFILYMGINERINRLPLLGANVWYLPYYDLEKIYSWIEKGAFEKAGIYKIRVSEDKKTIIAFVSAPYKSSLFWKHNKKRLSTELLMRIEHIIPNIKKHIIYLESAIPTTLHRYTLNYKGAAYGWAYTPSQLLDPVFSLKSFIKRLYLTGHWTTQTQGIAGVTYLGHSTAKLILKNENIIT